MTARLSLRQAQSWGQRLGRLVWYLRLGPARVTRINIDHCFPDLSAEARKTLARRSLEETGKTLFESGMVWEWPVERVLGQIRSCEGEEYARLAAGDRPILFMGLHYGNWEILGLYLAAHYGVSTLYAPPGLAGFDVYLRNVRERNGSRLLPANQRGVIQLMSVLKSGTSVAILPDQEPDWAGGVFAPFFGIEANTMKLASKIISRTGALPVLCAGIRLPDAAGFVLEFAVADDDIFDPDLRKSATALNRSIEKLVRKHPEQYQWEYKRFRKRPDKGPHFYD